MPSGIAGVLTGRMVKAPFTQFLVRAKSFRGMCRLEEQRNFQDFANIPNCADELQCWNVAARVLPQFVAVDVVRLTHNSVRFHAVDEIPNRQRLERRQLARFQECA